MSFEIIFLYILQKRWNDFEIWNFNHSPNTQQYAWEL